MLVIHTDYALHDAVTFHDSRTPHPLKYDDPVLITYAVPEEIDYFPKVRHITTPEHYRAIVRHLGFPIRPQFARLSDPQAIHHLRVQYGFDNEVRVVLSMIRSDAEWKPLSKFFRTLLEDENPIPHPLHFIIVYGDFLQLKNEIDQMGSKEGIDITLRAEIPAEEMADYMKIISRAAPWPGVLLSKTGGSMTAEAVAMGVYTVALDIKPHEICNRDYMIRCGMGELFDESNPTEQMDRLLRWKGSPTELYTPSLNWKKNLKRIVQEKIDKQDSSLLITE